MAITAALQSDDAAAFQNACEEVRSARWLLINRRQEKRQVRSSAGSASVELIRAHEIFDEAQDVLQQAYKERFRAACKLWHHPWALVELWWHARCPEEQM